MNPSIKVTLTKDFTDEWGTSFIAGQTGTTREPHYGGKALVDFDGYEKQRAQNQKMIEESGEGWNIVPWSGMVPVELLSNK